MQKRKASFQLNIFLYKIEETTVLEAYRQHVAERAAQGVPPKPLDEQQTASLVALLKNPPAGEEAFLVEL